MKNHILQGVFIIALLLGLVHCDTSHDIGLLTNNMLEPRENNMTTSNKPNRTRTHLFVFSFTIFKRKNYTDNVTDDSYQTGLSSLDQGMGETPEQTSFYNDRLRIPWLNQIPMRFLYFIASTSLLLLFLMIIKLIVSRRAKTDYSLVTKGDFDAWSLLS